MATLKRLDQCCDGSCSRAATQALIDRVGRYAGKYCRWCARKALKALRAAERKK